MSFKFTSASNRFVFIGDSVAQLIGVAAISPFFQVSQYIRGLYQSAIPVSLTAPFVPPVYRWPIAGFFNGTAGREAFTIGQTAPTFATFCQQMSGPFTHAIVQLGVNDASNVHAATRTLPQVLAAQGVILDGLLSIFGIPYGNMLCIGPWSLAAFPVEVPQIVTQWQTTIAARTSGGVGPSFIDWSGVPSNGGLTIGDGVHPSSTGAPLLAAQTQIGIARAA